MFPLLSVETSVYVGAVQPTDTSELTGDPSETVGWFGSLLHSRMFPMELGVNPLPVTETDWPLVKPVSGLALIVEAANASLLKPRRATPPTSMRAAATRKGCRISDCKCRQI